jgi:hypothetical protein
VRREPRDGAPDEVALEVLDALDADGVLQLNQPYALGGTLLTAGGTVNLSGGAYQQNVTAGTIVLNPVNVTGSALINTLQANTGIGAVSVANTLTLGFGGGQQTNIFGNLTLAAGTATLYATTTATSNNRLVKVVDSSTNGTTGTPTSYTSLAAAGSNYVFRGVELRPF